MEYINLRLDLVADWNDGGGLAFLEITELFPRASNATDPHDHKPKVAEQKNQSNYELVVRKWTTDNDKGKQESQGEYRRRHRS